MNDKDKDNKIIYLLLAIVAGLFLLALFTLMQAEALSAKDIRPVSAEQVDPPGSGVKIGSNSNKENTQ
jgi:heme/copper-type cytochrome/quinol oxidase subunit 1